MESRADTIAAIATAPGRGGVAVVRVSGPDAWAVAAKVTGRPLAAADAGRFFRARPAGGDPWQGPVQVILHKVPTRWRRIVV